MCLLLDLVDDAALIQQYRRPDAAPGEKWLPLRCIFALADHQGSTTS